MKVKKINERIENGNTHFVEFECEGSKFELVKDYSKQDEWVMKDDKIFLKSKQIDEVKSMLKQIDDYIFH